MRRNKTGILVRAHQKSLHLVRYSILSIYAIMLSLTLTRELPMNTRQQDDVNKVYYSVITDFPLEKLKNPTRETIQDLIDSVKESNKSKSLEELQRKIRGFTLPSSKDKLGWVYLEVKTSSPVKSKIQEDEENEENEEDEWSDTIPDNKPAVKIDVEQVRRIYPDNRYIVTQYGRELNLIWFREKYRNCPLTEEELKSNFLPDRGLTFSPGTRYFEMDEGQKLLREAGGKGWENPFYQEDFIQVQESRKILLGENREGLFYKSKQVTIQKVKQTEIDAPSRVMDIISSYLC